MATKYIEEMTALANSWPEEDQQELVQFARVIEARRIGLYRVTAEERSAISEGLAEADRGEHVENHIIADQERRHGM